MNFSFWPFLWFDLPERLLKILPECFEEFLCFLLFLAIPSVAQFEASFFRVLVGPRGRQETKTVFCLPLFEPHATGTN